MFKLLLTTIISHDQIQNSEWIEENLILMMRSLLKLIPNLRVGLIIFLEEIQ